jgi:serine protease Do
VLPIALGAVLLTAAAAADSPSAEGPLAQTIRHLQSKVVKIYGSGGFRGLEAYQSGFLISPEGHVLTVWSYVLDTDDVIVTLDDGRKFRSELLGAAPGLEMAVLKIEAAGLPCFDLGRAVEAVGGARVMALSNLFGVATGNEPVSVQHGVVSARTTLEARRGTFETPYGGPVYVLDAVTNNPGAAGGALVTRGGRLIGMLGKELRNARNNTWLNYAVPVGALRGAVDEIRAGKFAVGGQQKRDLPDRPLRLAMLGIVLVPDVLPRTPPYVDHVWPGSPAAAAGIRADDLILLVEDRLIQSSRALRAELEQVDCEDPVKLTVLRGQELLEFVLQARREDEAP